MEVNRNNKALALATNSPRRAQAWRRSSLSLAVGLLLSSVAMAQSSEGSLYGQGKAGTKVTVTSVETGTARQVQIDASGNFSLVKLPPGRYTVTSGDVVREVSVSIGSGTKVELDAAVLQQVQVTGSRARTGIDTGSVESNSVFTAEQLRSLPVQRNVNAVAQLAPGVVLGDEGLGNDGAGGLPSFGGASVAENGYYINGFDVTNIRNFLSYANLPFEAVAEQQLKTGGYGAEYGRSLGGVVSLVTKRGTNEWHGGATASWQPASLRSKGKNVKDLEPTRPGVYTVFKESDTREEFGTTLYLGGPIIKDKLFVFGVIDNQKVTVNDFGQTISTEKTSGTPNGLIKLDFVPNDQHRFELTYIDNKQKDKYLDYTNTNPYSTSNDGVAAESERTSGGDVTIGKWTGYLTDNLTVSALVGKVNDKAYKTTGARTAAANCPVVLEVDLSDIGCWAPPFPSEGVPDPAAPDNKDTREAYRFDIDYTFGKHSLRAGIDNQKFKSLEAGGSTYSGGVYWRYYESTDGLVNGVAGAVPINTQYVRGRVLQSTTGAYEVDNSAFYVEDNWRVAKNVLLYGGLRWESFNNKNGDGVSFVKADNLLAPRIGASWDVNGDASLKVFGNVGRYFIPVASNTNIRMTRGEIFDTRYYTFSGRDPLTQAPINPVQVGDALISSNGALPLPATVADTELKPMSQDEFILGFQKAVTKGWTVGVKGTYRKVNNGMDDWASQPVLEKWALANGYPNFDYETASGYALVNPGRDVHLMADLNNDGVLVPVTIPASMTGLAEYTRTYKAVEISFERQFDRKWGLQGSYTWSRSKGTAEGYVNSTIDQADAGVTQDFDHGSFTDGSDGFLANDRTHAIKLFGTYAVNDEWRVGFGFNATSGRPKSCIGFVPPTVPDYNGTTGNTAGSKTYASASTYYCLNDAGTTVLTQRGSAGRTPWTNTVDLQLAYMPKVGKDKLTLQVDIFNVFNSQGVTETDEIRDFSRATSLIPGAGQISANYGQPTAYQGPRAVRLTARYEF